MVDHAVKASEIIWRRAGIHRARNQTTGATPFSATLKGTTRQLFGLPGSTEAPLLEAIRADAEMRYVLTLQETVTVGWPTAHARAAQCVGVSACTRPSYENGLSQITTRRATIRRSRYRRQQRHGSSERRSARCPIASLGAASSNIRGGLTSSAVEPYAARDQRATANPPGPDVFRSPRIFRPATAPEGLGEQTAFAQRRTRTSNVALIARRSRQPCVSCFRATPDTRARRIDRRARQNNGALAEALGTAGVRDRAHADFRIALPVSDPRYLGQYAKASLIAMPYWLSYRRARVLRSPPESAAKLPDGAKLITRPRMRANRLASVPTSVCRDAGPPCFADLIAERRRRRIAGASARRTIASVEDLRTQYRTATRKIAAPRRTR